MSAPSFYRRKADGRIVRAHRYTGEFYLDMLGPDQAVRMGEDGSVHVETPVTGFTVLPDSWIVQTRFGEDCKPGGDSDWFLGDYVPAKVVDVWRASDRSLVESP